MNRLTALLIPTVLACTSPLKSKAQDAGSLGTGGSTIDLDSCSSDAECLLSCIWITAPTTASECTANYCCGVTWLSQKRCDINRAAWATYCPDQAPTRISCPCLEQCQNETFRCIAGRCSSSCPAINDAGPDVADVAVVASGGASGNGGGGGTGAANLGSGGSFASGVPAGAFLSVSVGDSYVCGVRTDGTIACWGDSSFGQAIPPAGAFTAVSAGASAACGLRTDGTIACWGDNTHGEATPPASVFTSVSAGGNYACGIRADGTIACWGDNTYGEAIPPSGSFLSVSVGYTAACAVKADGTLACWGTGYGYNNGETTPPAGSFASISVSPSAACGVSADGTLTCWGGTGAPDTPPAGTFFSVSAGSPLACAVNSADGGIACWQLPEGWGGGIY